jgi:hypothetical protein
VRRDGKPLRSLVVEALLDYIEVNLTTTTKADAHRKPLTVAVLAQYSEAECKDFFAQSVAGR